MYPKNTPSAGPAPGPVSLLLILIFFEKKQQETEGQNSSKTAPFPGTPLLAQSRGQKASNVLNFQVYTALTEMLAAVDNLPEPC